METGSLQVLTIGHSNHSYECFLTLLRDAHITAIADVRSSPFSRQFPHFNRETLRTELRLDGIVYVFLGNELGGRPRDRSLYHGGTADYEKIAATQQFIEGLERVIEGAKKYRIALMCSEQNPLDCHRALLVGRALTDRSLQVSHILHDGTVLPHSQIEEILLKLSRLSDEDLISSREERLVTAYRKRARKVAFAEAGTESTGADASQVQN